MIGDIFLAKRLNQILGGAFVTPFDLAEMPETTVDEILTLEKVSEYQQDLGKIENIFETWRHNNARE